MVTRVNGAPTQGVWFSANVRFLDLTVTNGDFLNDLTVPGTAPVPNSTLEVVLEAIATRGTIIGVTVIDIDDVNVMVDYAQAYDDAAVVAEVTALIDAFDGATPGLDVADLTASAFVVESGFAGATQGTPA